MLDNLSAGRKILAVFALFSAILVAGGGVVTWAFLRVAANGLEVGEHLSPIGDAAMELQLNAALANIEMEEILAGQDDRGFDVVERLLDESAFYVGAILDGAQNAEGHFHPTTSQAVRDHILAVRDDLETLKKSARDRFALMRSGQGVGSGADEQFDQTYEGLIEGLADLARTLPASAQGQAALGEARFRLAHGHLILEEVLGGDGGEDFAEVENSFAAAASAVASAADDLGRDGKDILAGISTLTQLARERHASMQDRAAAISAASKRFIETFDRFVETADKAEEVVHADMEAGLARLRASERLASIMLAATGLLLIVAILLAYRGLDASLGLRLRQLSSCMRALLDGDLAIKAPDWRSADEVGTLRDSVDEMRAAFLRQVELEKAAAASREVAERQAKAAEQQAALAEQGKAEAHARQQEAQRRAETASRFAQEFGTLVRNATGGKFGARMATDFGDASFDELARGMNDVMAAVERGLGETGQVLAAMARGELTARMRGHYEGAFATLKTDTNATVEQMHQTVVSINSAAQAIVAGTETIAASTEEISRRTTSQATALNETDGTTKELSGRVTANSESARRVASQARLATEQAEAGGSSLRRTVTAIQQIDDSAQKVKNIIDVIDDISFQTNLLALNAGVEAARAGEAGKGFAVVAQEVRQLAQRAAQAAQDIGTLIEKSLHDVAEGVHLVNETGDVLSEVLKAIAGVAEATQEITAANETQTAGITEISSKIATVGKMTQQNAGIAESSARSARSLSDEAHQLSDLLAFFHTDPNARDSGSTNRPARSAA
ncbi:MAG: methyl-accepting chemotaxis protein [Pseudooceanicola sp.]|nr:methyl-accepting chemotaxis protein [Pseudooceanicola sp.]